MALEAIGEHTKWTNFHSKWISAAILERACRDFPNLMVGVGGIMNPVTVIPTLEGEEE